MILDLQKASVLKRASAFLLDLILFSILAVGFAALISTITHYDTYSQTDNEIANTYAEQYFGMTWDEYKKLSEEERKSYEQAYKDFEKALSGDEKYMRNSSMMISLSILMVTLGIFFAMLVLEFIVPLLFKNGQTVGKKIFGIAVMGTNSVKASNVSLFIRAMLGKYTIETMFPIFVFMMLFTMPGIGWTPIIVIVGLLALQIAVFFVSHTNALIHDMISNTVTVDLASQMIFDSEEKLISYKAKLAAEDAERSAY